MSQEWEPIATAPKDRYIWGFDPCLKRPFEMIWNVPANAFVATAGFGDESPTHWIDFPPLPTAAALAKTAEVQKKKAQAAAEHYQTEEAERQSALEALLAERKKKQS